MTALWPAQKAVYARLSSSDSLTSRAGVYDHVPEDADHPYVTVGEGTEVPFDAHDRRGASLTLTLHVWSRYRGYREALDILADVDRLLDQRGGADPLQVDGHRRVFTRRESYNTTTDPDPDIRHVPATYRIDLEEEQ